MQFKAYFKVVFSNVLFFLVSIRSIILLFLQMKKLRCREEEICPKSLSQVSGRPEIRLRSSRFFICCSPLRSQLPFCWRQFSQMEFVLPGIQHIR